MHQFYSVMSLIAFCVGVTSAGIVDRIQYNPIKSFFQGTKGADAFQSQHNIPYEAAIFDDDILINHFQTTSDYERPTSTFSKEPSTISKLNRRPSLSRRRPQSSTRRKPSTLPQSSTRRKPSTLPRRSNTKKVDVSPIPVTGAHAVVGTHFGEISIFTSNGRLWLNATSLERPVPLGAAKDSDSISVGNKNANEIWVNTTSWYKLVSLDDVAAGRRPVSLPKEKRKPVKVDSDIVERRPLSKGSISSDFVTRPPIVLPEKGTYQYDTCGLNVVLPLTADRIVLREQGIKPNYKSTGFPHERDYPLVCTWNIKVNKVCRRARITMKVDERSRLPDVAGCIKGYLQISPFMNQTRLCGRIDSIPPYHWYVDDQQPNDVIITMKNIGINDGYSEGLSFTLQGECLPIERGTFDVDKENVESNTNWMDRLVKEIATTGYGATLADSSVKLTPKKPSLSEVHPDDGKRHVNSTHVPAVPIDQIFYDAISYITTLF
ncbi:uncharacterized protein LOC130696553 [Daphnia carinata]|uniref:uncharacterized protein LOC130696553 n=1 Tax=Daphnia carinata TaxID=120202 RepID=UPI00257DB344|nr:uncharacterized protein LOC130696553 [Daphnia carinata]